MGCSLGELVPLASKGSVESLCEGGGVQRSRILYAESNIGSDRSKMGKRENSGLLDEGASFFLYAWDWLTIVSVFGHNWVIVFLCLRITAMSEPQAIMLRFLLPTL